MPCLQVRRNTVAIVTIILLMATAVAGCQRAKIGTRCRTTDWGDDGGSWVLQCRNGRWVRALTKADAARILLPAPATTAVAAPTTPPFTAPTYPGTTAPPYVAPPTTLAPQYGPALKVSVGGDHTCALLVGHSVRCWGLNSGNQLGDGTSGGTILSVQDTPVAVAGLADATDLASGYGFSCAIRSTATVVCWGDGSSGAMGNGGQSTDLHSLVTVPGLTGAVSLVAENGAICAVLASGPVSCWGSSPQGQLVAVGSGPTVLSPTVRTGVTSPLYLGLGDDHACAILSDHTVSCWGANASGQLAQAASGPQSTPAAVPSLAGASAVEASGYSTCAVVGGAVFCWGGNGYGQLGTGSTDTNNHVSPAVVPGLTGIVGLSGRADAYCALTTGGRVWCWGAKSNTVPDGSGDIALSSTPLDMGLSGIASINGAGNSACAVTTTGAVKCWGTNEYGQLGNRTMRQSGCSRIPVSVLGIG